MKNRWRSWRRAAPKRLRTKVRAKLNREHGLTRRQLGAMGAGHEPYPDEYLWQLKVRLKELAQQRPPNRKQANRVRRRILGVPSKPRRSHRRGF